MANSACRSLLGSVVISLMVAPPVWAAVAPTSLKKLTVDADYIVVGRVTSVLELEGVSVAILRVDATLKGAEVREIAFLAQGTWTCDISGAEQGEEVLMFLEGYKFDPNPQPRHEKNTEAWSSTFKEPAGFREAIDDLGMKAPFMSIFWSGRGRMPMRYVDGQAYVTVWTMEIELPKGLSTIDGPEEEYAFIRSAPMEQIIDFVAKWSPRR